MTRQSNSLFVFIGGFSIGILGGLIGLGGAEFRLPLLISFFQFAALEAVILNKAMSLIVVSSALPFRTGVIPFSEILNHWYVIAILLSGSLIGAWQGASWAIKMRTQTLYRTIAILLLFIAAILLFGHGYHTTTALFAGWQLIIVGALVGVVIGFVASLMGVAGGELLIPTIVLLFGLDLKLAGSLSLMVSLPTMLMGFVRYSQDKSFQVIKEQGRFVLLMAIGSIAGTFVGGILLGILTTSLLMPLLAMILIVSAWKVWKH